MSRGGHVPIPRELLDELLTRYDGEQLKVFLALYSSAAYESQTVTLTYGTPVVLQIGETIIATRKLATHLRVEHTKVRRSLARFERDGRIRRRSAVPRGAPLEPPLEPTPDAPHAPTVITIVNYASYTALPKTSATRSATRSENERSESAPKEEIKQKERIGVSNETPAARLVDLHVGLLRQKRAAVALDAKALGTWRKEMQGILDSGRTADEVESALRFALSHSNPYIRRMASTAPNLRKKFTEIVLERGDGTESRRGGSGNGVDEMGLDFERSLRTVAS